MRTALYGVDVVNVRVYVFRIVGIVHDGHLDGDALLLCFQVDDIIKEVRSVAVNVADELFKTVFGVENLRTCLALLVGTQVSKGDADACIQECQLSHAPRNDIPLEVSGCEYRLIWPELLTRSTQVGLSNDFHGVEGFSPFVFLLVNFAVTEHLRCHVRG